MSTTENLIQKYDINLAVFMKLNFNWTKVNSSSNLASWLQQEEKETQSVTAHNTHKFDDIFSKHHRVVQAWCVGASFPNTQGRHCWI
jgi:hypothetical protein